MIVYVLEFENQRIEFSTIELANQYKIDNYIDAIPFQFEKVFEEIADIIEIPQEVQLWRVRTILKLNGLESNIETALNGLDEPIKTGSLYVWNYGITIERGSATVQLLQYVLGLTDTQVDDIFIQANEIQI